MNYKLSKELLPKPERKKVVGFKVTDELAETIDKIAAANNITKGKLLEIAIYQLLEKN